VLLDPEDEGIIIVKTLENIIIIIIMDPLIRSVSRVTIALANVSSVSQLFFFLVVY
jgi:hypothetical protein